MKTKGKSIQEKEAIIAEYLLGNTSYRKLGKKHEVDFRVIHSWVAKFEGIPLRKEKSIKLKKQEAAEEILPVDVKQLQAELRKAQLHNKLLNAIIDIAEDQLKIDIRKKSGTKR